MESLWSKPMTCTQYMSRSCGLECCLAKAEQFASFDINEPLFVEFCPLVQRYGEMELIPLPGAKSESTGCSAS